jgi:hypothetical protein
MKDFNSYMQNRKSNAQKLAEQMKKPTYSNEDSRFWKPTMDKEAGVGGALIRFLPTPDDATLDYVEYRNYSFKWADTQQWFIEKSLYTLGIEDPVYQLKRRLSATKQELDAELVKAMPLTKVFIANILVINDPAHPENNGKTFLYRYNATIQGLIDKALNPVINPITGKTPASINAFDLVEGADLEIQIQTSKQGWRYEGTKFHEPRAVVESQEDFQALMGKLHSLYEFTAPEAFKTYDQLAARLLKVMGKDYIGTGVPVLTNPISNPTTSTSSAPKEQAKATPAPEAKPAISFQESAPFEPDTSDDDALFDDMMNSMK